MSRTAAFQVMIGENGDSYVFENASNLEEAKVKAKLAVEQVRTNGGSAYVYIQPAYGDPIFYPYDK